MLVIDLYCGLGGWAEGFLAEGYDVIGFDIGRHDYGSGGYPGQLVLQDVLTLHGSQFRQATCIVASPPCQEYSYMAMPWKRSRQIAAALRGVADFPGGYTGSRSVAELNALVYACFRIQQEACIAAGTYIPLIVENVKGAQPWLGRAKWHFGSHYLWGDVPALMPIGRPIKNNGGTWFNIGSPGQRETNQNPVHGGRKGHCGTWFGSHEGRLARGGYAALIQHTGTGGAARKAASAMIAKIPFPLARHIARCFAEDRRS